MYEALFRLSLPDGSSALAGGTSMQGPDAILKGLRLDQLLTLTPAEFWNRVDSAEAAPLPSDAIVVAPVESQEVWAAGVTYAPSREAREVESGNPDIYESAFDASRPELFFKSQGPAVRGPGDPIAIRSDSTWDAPEPELALVLTSRYEIAAITIANDMSSRSIEGANPLYLPQAKNYDGACAVGPCLVRPTAPVQISLQIERAGAVVFDESASTSQIRRPLDDLARWLGRGRSSPVGVLLLTGTPIVPPPGFTLKADDQVIIGIDGLGTLQNRVEVLECGPAPRDESARDSLISGASVLEEENRR